MSGTDRRRPLAAWLAIVLLLIGAAFGWFLLPLHEWADAFSSWVQGLGVLGPAFFLIAYVVAVVALVPASAMTLAAGLAFGFWAVPLVLAAATIGSAVAFLIARYVVGDKVRSLLAGLPRSKAVYDAVGRGGWKMLFLLRLSPLMPFSVMNYLLGTTELSLWTYVSATFLGVIPALILYVYLGALGRAAIAGDSGGTIRWIVLIFGLAAAAAAIVYVGRKAAAELRKSGVTT
ncbi:MAG: TVP38/TMEM64 family protein [Hyphomicrobiales bacterium]